MGCHNGQTRGPAFQKLQKVHEGLQEHRYCLKLGTEENFPGSPEAEILPSTARGLRVQYLVRELKLPRSHKTKT